ncbi:MAG: GAF domain-containing protein [Anaerolineae bacterium]|nr:GAF domain-containing protein [Anaerolineae bacterium]
MDLQEVLSQVITRTNEIFQAEAGSVALLEPSGDKMVIRAAVGAGADAVRGLSLPAGKGVVGWVVTHEKPALIPDVSQDERFYRSFDERSGFRTQSIMCVPLRANGHTIGVIELMNMNPDYLSDNGLKLLSVIADHAALAIENTQLLAETRQRSEEQALLFEAMAIVTSDLALETVLDAVSRQMVEALKADLCLISHWEKEDDRLYLMQSYTGPGTRRPEQSARSLDRNSLLYSILVSQTPGVLEAGTPQPEQAAWLEELKVQALFLIPLIYRRQTIGLVELGRVQSTQVLSQSELRLLETMAAQAAVAIEHARLYREATRHLAEAKVLQEVMVAAASSLDFDRVISGTMSALHRTLGIERLGFFLPGEDDNMVVVHPATIGFNLNEGNLSFPAEHSAIGWVFRHGRALLLPNVREASHYYELAPDTQSEICVPVLVNGQVVAVLNAESPRLNAFDYEDLRLFQAIAAELAVALENARLFAEIRAAEANYRDLFDNANDFIFTLDGNFRISSANKVVLKTTGYQLDEIIGAPATQFILPQQISSLYKLLKMHLASTESLAPFELSVLGKDKTETLLEVTLRVRREGRRPVSLHFIARDITHRRELEQQLQQTEKLSAIGKLVAGVAHELNNPLTTIIGYSSLLQQSNLPEETQADLNVIFRQAQRARLIVRDLLTFARRFDLETRPVDLNEIIGDSVSLVKAQLQMNAVQVKIDLDAELPMTMADPHQLEQVFINLMTNAIHALATKPDPRQLVVESSHDDEHIFLSFADNGPGIPAQHLSRVFDPFFSTKGVGEGTGLGLSICFGIISEHKGRIWAENSPNGGAIFTIQLPIEKPPLATPAGSPPAATGTTTFASPLKILAVDDEPALLNLLRLIFTQRGHQVVTAPDGLTAMQKLETQTFDLIVCDVLMPDILGPELYQTATKKYPYLVNRFIFITGNVVDMDTRIFLEKSGLAWLSKPFLPADIEQLVERTAARIQDYQVDLPQAG